MTEINTLDELIAYCKDNNRICPQPQFWNELWEKLKDKKQINSSWQPENCIFGLVVSIS